MFLIYCVYAHFSEFFHDGALYVYFKYYNFHILVKIFQRIQFFSDHIFSYQLSFRLKKNSKKI